MADGSRDRGGRGRSLAACIAALSLIAAVAPSAAAAGLLDGKTRVRDVDVLSIRKGGDRGSLLVWVRASHATASAGARSRESAGATHAGGATVIVRGSRGAIRLRARRALTLGDGPGPLEHAYTLRIRPGMVDRLGLDSEKRLAIRTRVTQRLDLDGDGDSDASRADTDASRVRRESVAQAIAPSSGVYQYSERGAKVRLAVEGGAVTMVFGAYLVEDSGCDLTATQLSFPINPMTGTFKVDWDSDAGSVKLFGEFLPGTGGAEASGSLTGTGIGSLARCPPLNMPFAQFSFLD